MHATTSKYMFIVVYIDCRHLLEVCVLVMFDLQSKYNRIKTQINIMSNVISRVIPYIGFEFLQKIVEANRGYSVYIKYLHHILM